MASRSIGGTLVAGILVVAPVYLGLLLLLKAIKSLAGLLKPLAGMLPDWLPVIRSCLCYWCCWVAT